MLSPMRLDDIEKYHMIPQAIIRRPVSFFADKMGTYILKGNDDLDFYEATGLFVDGLPFAVKHYQGEPKDTATIFLADHIRSLQQITDIVHQIIRELGLPLDSIAWERSQDPTV
jgi:hypothetical protein